ncbi:MAG: exodeoxyribonuclease VII large subunit [Treponema sp.]|jgi:exodeoxyribonuclease VII large subunit|nr:exodeoxyribonuclease VII large subunit [Treponema sp.]
MDASKKFSVSEITELIRQSLEGTFPLVVVEGELSNCRPSSTGHLYFTLKDSGAAISCMMFRGQLRTLRFEPKDGMLLRVKGRVSVYAPKGTYSIVCDEMEQAGAGDILAMLEERKRRLAAEGLFDAERKPPIPRFAETVGVISSPTGAAVRDILNVLRRRAPGLRIILLPAQVQGADAGPAIARRIRQANMWGIADVLIVGRGGGSLEDLLPFSDEVVVRAASASEIPIVSAVGHEIDWSLLDYAASLRAPTPSAAAELVSADWPETAARVRALSEALSRGISVRLEKIRLALKPFSLEDLEYRFRGILQPRLVRFDDAKEGLLNAIRIRLEGLRHRVELSRRGLEAASPLAILERGYAVATVLRPEGERVLRSAADVARGDRIRIRPLKGKIEAAVESVEA